MGATASQSLSGWATRDTNAMTTNFLLLKNPIELIAWGEKKEEIYSKRDYEQYPPCAFWTREKGPRQRKVTAKKFLREER